MRSILGRGEVTKEQRKYFVEENSSFENYLFSILKKEIEKSDSENIKKYKNEISTIISENLNDNKSDSLIIQIQEKLKSDKNVKKKKVLDAFDEAAEDNENIKEKTIKSKIIQEL